MLGFVRGLFEMIHHESNHYQLSEWAEKKRIIPSGLSSRAGPFRWRITPYLREPADCLSESSPVREVAIMKGARIGYTVAIIENHIGYMIDKCPGSAMLVTATKDMARMMTELRIDPMLEYAGLSGKISSQSRKRANKKTGDSNIKKEFPGGYLLIGSPTGPFLRGNGARYLYLDELDEWPHQIGTSDKSKGKKPNQGDPILLARRRAAEFEGRKIVYGSTPLDDSTSKIKPLFEEGDQCYYHVPCPKCGRFQILRWQDEKREDKDRFRMKYKTDDDYRLIEDSVYYECENKKCRHHWKNADKETFLERGKWIPSKRPRTARFRSFHISSLYSPMESWEDVCREWLKTKDNPGALRTFTNTFLGETWKESGEAPKAAKVFEQHVKGYKAGTLPSAARPLFLTIGADVQKDRIEAEVVAWGRGFESWSIEYLVMHGDTSDIYGEAWSEMARVIETPHADRMAHMVMIDSNFNSPVVVDFCKRYNKNIMPIKGRRDLDSTKGTSGVYRLFPIKGTDRECAFLDTTFIKIEVYNYLKYGTKTGEPPIDPTPGYCHFPRDYSKDHYNRLMSATRVAKKMPNGYVMWVWEEHGRDEPLDARVYAQAGIYILYGENLKLMEEAADEGEEVHYPMSRFWDEWEARSLAEK